MRRQSPAVCDDRTNDQSGEYRYAVHLDGGTKQRETVLIWRSDLGATINEMLLRVEHKGQLVATGRADGFELDASTLNAPQVDKEPFCVKEQALTHAHKGH